MAKADFRIVILTEAQSEALIEAVLASTSRWDTPQTLKETMLDVMEEVEKSKKLTITLAAPLEEVKDGTIV